MRASRWFTVVLVGILATASLPASDQIPARKQDHPIALTGGIIHPVSGPAISNAAILFDKGRILAIGSSLSYPEGTEIIDITGKHVYPGLISSDTEIGLVEIGAVRATRDQSETGRINPNVRAQAAFNPESEIIPVTRANGITMFVTAPSSGLISGTSAIMLSDGWTWEDMTFKAPAALVVNWPRMTISTAPWVRQSEEDQKKEIAKQLEELDEALRDARSYKEARAADAALPVDVRWEAMLPFLDRSAPVVIIANEIQQIQAAVAWGEAEGLRIIIAGGTDAWRAADLLKRHDIPVITGGIQKLPSRRFDAYDEPFVLPMKLHKAGIRFAISTGGGAAHERSLPYHAATAAAYGLPAEEALRAITLSPAEIFGIADRVGSLDPGKDATMIVTNGDPLEIMTAVEMEFIQGRRIDLTSRHTMLNDKYIEKYSRGAE